MALTSERARWPRRPAAYAPDQARDETGRWSPEPGVKKGPGRGREKAPAQESEFARELRYEEKQASFQTESGPSDNFGADKTLDVDHYDRAMAPENWRDPQGDTFGDNGQEHFLRMNRNRTLVRDGEALTGTDGLAWSVDNVAQALEHFQRNHDVDMSATELADAIEEGLIEHPDLWPEDENQWPRPPLVERYQPVDGGIAEGAARIARPSAYDRGAGIGARLKSLLPYRR